MARSETWGPGVSVSVALLAPGPGSLLPAATATVAVFTRLPVALERSVTTRVNVAVPPTGTSTVSLRFPATGPAVQVAPPAATQVHEAEATCGRASTVSVTVAFSASEGPAFETTIVYVTVPPAV